MEEKRKFSLRGAYSRLTPGQKRRFLAMIGVATGTRTRKGKYDRVLGKVIPTHDEYVRITGMSWKQFSIREEDLWGE